MFLLNSFCHLLPEKRLVFNTEFGILIAVFRNRRVISTVCFAVQEAIQQIRNSTVVCELNKEINKTHHQIGCYSLSTTSLFYFVSSCKTIVDPHPVIGFKTLHDTLLHIDYAVLPVAFD